MFRDRKEAGKLLAEKLKNFGENSIVLAIPRGGVPVALEVAKKLNVFLDVIVVRKIPIPWEPEAGYGAVTDDGTVVLNESMVNSLRLSQGQISIGVTKVKQEIERRRLMYTGVKRLPSLKNKVVILVDDGLASGFTMIAAIKSARNRNARKVIAAAPVASKSAFNRVKEVADDVVCLLVSDNPVFAVASFYENWYDLSDDEVLALLRSRTVETINDRNL